MVVYLFICEYIEDILKNLLIIFVLCISFIISKFIIFFFWIMMLILVVWVFILILGLLGNFFGFNIFLFLGFFLEFLICGGFFFLLFLFIVLLIFVMKSYVFFIILIVIIIMINFMFVNFKYKDLFLWIVILDIVNNEL